MTNLLRAALCVAVATVAACDQGPTYAPPYLTSECLSCVGQELDDRCRDGLDNDADQLVDCADPDCAAAYACNASGPEDNAQFCADGLDNDDNGYTDCEDFSCRPTAACRTEVKEDEETTAEQCSDGLDNDWNNFIDCDDFGCGASPVCEGSNETCDDGKDNDFNGFTDCADFSCSQNSNVTVCD